jgi:hypothetical protein
MANPKDAPLGSGMAKDAANKIQEAKKKKQEQLDSIMRDINPNHTIKPNPTKNK